MHFLLEHEISLSKEEVAADIKAANEIRGHIAELCGIRSQRRIVLAPGIFMTLRPMFSFLGVRRVLLGTEEYVSKGFFHDSDEDARPDQILETVKHREPDVVILSLVTWKGEVLPVRDLFREIRHLKSKVPLLVCDYAHAGAAGFPSARRLNADLVCGDCGKWSLTPEGHRGGAPCFFWFADQSLFKRARVFFTGNYLAVMRPREPKRILPWIDRDRINRTASLLRKYEKEDSFRRNFELAKEIANRLSIPSPHQSCLLFIPKEKVDSKNRLLIHLRKYGYPVFWEVPDGVRITCRSDVVSLP